MLVREQEAVSRLSSTAVKTAFGASPTTSDLRQAFPQKTVSSVLFLIAKLDSALLLRIAFLKTFLVHGRPSTPNSNLRPRQASNLYLSFPERTFGSRTRKRQ